MRAMSARASADNAIAPTGTISLAFADNASNGIEPSFSWFYTRKKRMADDSRMEYQVEDHAYRLFKRTNGIGDTVFTRTRDSRAGTRTDASSVCCGPRARLSIASLRRASSARA